MSRHWVFVLNIWYCTGPGRNAQSWVTKPGYIFGSSFFFPFIHMHIITLLGFYYRSILFKFIYATLPCLNPLWVTCALSNVIKMVCILSNSNIRHDLFSLVYCWFPSPTTVSCPSQRRQGSWFTLRFCYSFRENVQVFPYVFANVSLLWILSVCCNWHTIFLSFSQSHNTHV